MDYQTMNGTLWVTTAMMAVSNTSSDTTRPPAGMLPVNTNDGGLRRINAKYATFSIVTILVNLLILLLILTSKENRRKPFLWHIASISIWYLFFGGLTIPLKFDYQRNVVWRHGLTVCRLLMVSEICHLSLCCLILLCASVERILAKIQLTTPVNQTFSHILNRVLVILPWALMILITLPLMLASIKEYEGQGITWCTLSIDDAYYVRTIAVMFMLPMSVMALNIYFLILFYILKGENWSRLPSETSEEEITSLRMSTVAIWLACIVFFASWVPVITTASVMIFFHKDACMLRYETQIVVEAMYESTGATIPFMWLFVTEIRTSIMSCVRKIGYKIRMRNFKHMNTQMNWSARSEQNQF